MTLYLHEAETALFSLNLVIKILNKIMADLVSVLFHMGELQGRNYKNVALHLN
jgi:hypothetical protein